MASSNLLTDLWRSGRSVSLSSLFAMKTHKEFGLTADSRATFCCHATFFATSFHNEPAAVRCIFRKEVLVTTSSAILLFGSSARTEVAASVVSQSGMDKLSTCSPETPIREWKWSQCFCQILRKGASESMICRVSGSTRLGMRAAWERQFGWRMPVCCCLPATTRRRIGSMASFAM